MSWLFSRALLEEFLVGTCSAGAQCALSSGSHTPQAFLPSDRMMDFSRPSRSGMTFAPLMEDLGEELLTWFLEGSRARTSALQGREMGLTESAAVYGQKWQGSLAKYNRVSCSWKTAQCSLLGDSEEFSETWPRWGSMRNGALYQQPMPARHISANVSGLWPTVCARDYKGVGRSRLERTGSKSGECLPQAIGGLLNPVWAEWLMGWPAGWTELKPLGTDKFREWLQEHGSSFQRDSD